MESWVRKEPRNLGKDFSLLERRSLVTFLSSYVFQFYGELGREWFEKKFHNLKVGNTPATWRLSYSPATDAGG